jgi:hypothetical protein
VLKQEPVNYPSLRQMDVAALFKVLVGTLHMRDKLLRTYQKLEQLSNCRLSRCQSTQGPSVHSMVLQRLRPESAWNGPTGGY